MKFDGIQDRVLRKRANCGELLRLAYLRKGKLALESVECSSSEAQFAVWQQKRGFVVDLH